MTRTVTVTTADGVQVTFAIEPTAAELADLATEWLLQQVFDMGKFPFDADHLAMRLTVIRSKFASATTNRS